MHTIQRFDKKKKAEGKTVFKRRSSKLNYSVKIYENEKELNIIPVLDKI